MCPIKFRAWAPSGRMVDWDELMGLHVQTVFKMCQPDMVLMQYAGMMDDEFNEIYEGDIIKSNKNMFFDDGFQIRVVEFKDGQFLLGSVPLKIVVESFHPIVIGNIYQNPELMELSNANT